MGPHLPENSHNKSETGGINSSDANQRTTPLNDLWRALIDKSHEKQLWHENSMHTRASLCVPENDGWSIGYEVEMNGLGIVNLHDDSQNVDTSDNSYASDYSGEEDNSDSEVKRVGYRPLLTDAPLSRTGTSTENHVSEESLACGAFPVNHISREAQNVLHVDLPPLVNKDDFKIPHRPVDIHLNEEKVSQIKSVMSNISLRLSLPAWDKKIEDRKLADLVRELVNKT